MTQPPPVKDLIRYDLLVQEALKGVVRRVLTEAGRDGLQGDHHFYISFRTDYPGVRLSQRMREKYPDEMTIVLQHQFWDLGVTEHTFEVGLSFSGVPERLLIPFDAVVGFFDPSVQFGLKFELQGEASVLSGEPGEPVDAKAGAVTKPGLRAVSATEAGAEPLRGAASEPAETPPSKPRKGTVPASGSDRVTPADETTEDNAGADAAARVVSLDAFRKKT